MRKIKITNPNVQYDGHGFSFKDEYLKSNCFKRKIRAMHKQVIKDIKTKCE